MKMTSSLGGASRLIEFASRETWAEAIAIAVANDIAGALEKNAEVGIVVPGGRTPAPVFARMAKAPLAWSRVTICPTDERWVHPHHPDSNERSIRENLVAHGATARLLSLWTDAASPSQGESAVEARVAAMPRPFAAVVSGVGEDGHFASLFPGVAATPGGLDLSRPQSCIAIDAPQAGHPRLSLTLRAMLDCPRVRVIVTGAAKREVLEKATAMKDASLPVSLLLAQEQTPVDVYWAP